MNIHDETSQSSLLKHLSIDCDRCCGLCCTALFFSTHDGFPEDKEAGKPCRHLAPDFRCSIHEQLIRKRMKGCITYDCIGAGQIVTKLYSEKNWSLNPEIKNQMFQVFIKVHTLQQMLWYLVESTTLLPAKSLNTSIKLYIKDIMRITSLSPKHLLETDIAAYQISTNQILKKAAGLVQKETRCHQKSEKKNTFFGYNFKGANLNGYDFSSTLLIASNLEHCSLKGCNFLGADMRDVNIQNTDLSDSIFLTQGQLNSARGNSCTKIPPMLKKPVLWD